MGARTVSTELKMRQMTRVGPFQKGQTLFRLVVAILYVNNRVLTARFNGRTVESLILRNSLISKSDSLLTTHRAEIGRIRQLRVNLNASLWATLQEELANPLGLPSEGNRGEGRVWDHPREHGDLLGARS
jgi:hypothetical protein